jgi:hypothetical protein
MSAKIYIMNNLNDYIIVIKSALSIEACNQILDEFKNSNEWNDCFVYLNTYDKNIRSCMEILISTDSVIEKNKIKRKNLDDIVFASAAKCINEYNASFTSLLFRLSK